MVRWDIDWGDGNPDVGLAEPIHTYADPGTYTVDGSAYLDSLRVVGSGDDIPLPANGDGVVGAEKLLIDATASFDLKDNALILTNQSRATVEALIKAGLNNGNWAGTGVRSSTAGTTTNHSLGIVDNAAANYGTFAHQNVSSTDVLVRYTWTGDANLDGLISPDDFTQFVNGFGGPNAMWRNGDFNYDGFVSPDDFTLYVSGVGAFNGSGHHQIDQDGDLVRLDKIAVPEHTITVRESIAIDNFGFEDPTLTNPGDSYTSIPSWTSVGTTGSSAVVHRPSATELSAPEGMNVGHLVKPAGIGSATIEQELDATLEENSTYVLHATVIKTAGSAQEIFFDVSLFAENFKLVAAEPLNITGGPDRFEVELRVNSYDTSNAAHLDAQLKIQLSTRSTVQFLEDPIDLAFDDISLVVVPVSSTVDLKITDPADLMRDPAAVYLPVNADFDQVGVDADDRPVPDYIVDATAQTLLQDLDNEIRGATLKVGGDLPGRWMLNFPETIAVWRQVDASYLRVNSGELSANEISSETTISLKIEGLQPSAEVNDVQIVASFVPSDGESATDTVLVTVAGVDVDIDSDNNDLYDLPGRTWDEESVEAVLEEGHTEPGKIVYINDDDDDLDGVDDNIDGYDRDGSDPHDDVTTNEQFVPVVLQVNGPFDPENARFRIQYPGSDPLSADETNVPGKLRLWVTDGNVPRNGAGVSQGAFYIEPDPLSDNENLFYSGVELGLSDAHRVLTVWLEAAGTSPEGFLEIAVSVDPDGDGTAAGFELSDSVFVTTEPSAAEGRAVRGFKWNDLNGDGIRNFQSAGAPANLVYIIDVSGSTLDPLDGFEDVITPPTEISAATCESSSRMARSMATPRRV